MADPLQRQTRMLDTWLSDLRLAARRLVRQPWLALVAILTLALGLGANTAIFSFVSALLLRPLAVPAPERLVRLSPQTESGYDALSWPNAEDVRRESQSLAGLAAHQRVRVTLGADERLAGELVSGDYFEMLRLRPVLGRLLSPQDADRALVVSARFWRDRLGADPGALGRPIMLNGVPFTVVGVAPFSFRGSYDAFDVDFWAPLTQHETLRPRGLPLDRRGWGWLFASARLKDGVDFEAARAEIAALGKRLAERYPKENDGLRLTLTPATALPDAMRVGATKALAVLTLVVALVLVVASANVASALLARVLGRRREMAVRTALGAGRARLVRLWLAEGLLIALLASAAGVVLAGWVADGLLALRPPASEYADFSPRLGLDVRVLVFSLVTMALTGLGLGAVPALRASRPDVAGALRDDSGATTGRQSRWLSAFVVAQVAASAALVLTASLLLRSVAASRAFDAGFETARLVVADLNLERTPVGVSQGAELGLRAVELVGALHGVEGATLGCVPPLGDARESWGVRIVGFEPREGDGSVTVNGDFVGPRYFETLRIPLLRGRDFTAADMAASAAPVAVVNQTMAQQFWPGGEALGGRVLVGDPPTAAEVVGIARDIKYYTLGEAPRAYLYVAAGRFGATQLALFARTAGPDAEAVPRVRRALRDEFGAGALLGAMTFEELRDMPLFPGRVLGAVMTGFGLVALLLASVGLYGVMAHAVSQRSREIGIRMALGAAPPQILASVIRHGLLLAGLGIGLGILAAAGLVRALGGLLFGVSFLEPAAFAPLGLLLSLALVACLVPALRATRLDPVSALRQD